MAYTEQNTRAPPPPNFDDSPLTTDELTVSAPNRTPLPGRNTPASFADGASKATRSPKRARMKGGEALIIAEEEARKVGGVIPGDDPTEIERWIAERRRNWPSRANVARKLEEQRKKVGRGQVAGGELGMLAEAYESSDSEKDGETTGAKGDDVLVRGTGRRDDGLRRDGGRRQPRRKGASFGQKKGQRNNLLRALLEKEIRREQNYILQCFRVLVNSDFMTSSNENDYIVM